MALPIVLVSSFIDELEREGATTARLLERVPLDRLEWRPHPRSMTLGDLAWHIATIPARIAFLVQQRSFDLSKSVPSVREGEDFVAQLQRSLKVARGTIETFDESSLTERFTITRDGTVVISLPIAGAIRTIMLNHSVHHRGQLTVYLRLLDVPLPIIYGSSADEQP